MRHYGLGIGLYQAARVGYRLELSENQVGRVSFRLLATDSRHQGIPDS